MKQCSPEIIDHTVAFWSDLSGKNVNIEDARQAIDNIVGFFRVLESWRSKEQDSIKGYNGNEDGERISNNHEDN